MAKLHNALATTELHNPKGIGVESFTETILTMSASLGAVSASASIVPHTADTYNLGSDTQRWNNITAAGNISSSTTSTGSFTGDCICIWLVIDLIGLVISGL